MANPRTDILAGFQAAEKFHRKFDSRNRYVRPGGRIDIFQMAVDNNVPVMFRELDGLLGAYLPAPSPGILITTKRQKSVQRFTCAHEFGHFWLNHEQSFDDESMIGFAYSNSSGGKSIERQADAFAFSCLMPRWLVVENIRRLAKAGLSLPSPNAVYQLSLRLGCSYSATLLTLENYRILSVADANKLKLVKPRDIKIALVGNTQVDDWHRDVWLITEGDEDAVVDAAEGDLFVTHVQEASTAGYITNTDNLVAAGFTLLNERILVEGGENCSDPIDPSTGIVGSFPTHETILKSDSVGAKQLQLRQGRPWEPPEDAQTVLDITVDVQSPAEGLSRQERQSLLRNFRND